MKAAACGSFLGISKRWGVFLLFLFTAIAIKAQVPTAGFTATSTSGCTPLIVNFTDQSSGSPTSWHWDLGNGVTSTLQNPSTIYTQPGTYTIRLTATNASGSNTMTRVNYITVNVPPTVQFTSNTTGGCFPLPVQFTDASSPGFGSIVSWRWAFGNGDTSNQQNPLYTYYSSGSYLVSLTVTNSAGCTQTLVRNNYVNVSNGVTADFSVPAPASCNPPETINFTNLTAGPATLSYQWDFGDGSPVSTALNPSHLYSSPGPFTVRLIAASTQGCVDTVVKQQVVRLNDFQAGIASADSACVNTSILFQNTSVPLPTNAFWDFGNGNTSTDTNPVISYATAGNYIIRLINQYGVCNDTITKNIRILPRPVTAFTSTDLISCRAPHTVNFTNQSTGAVSYQWDFGDGSPGSTATNPTHTYTSTGNFTVRLITVNSSGCTDTLVRTNYIRIQRPVLNPLFSPFSGCAPLTVNMQANSTSLDNITSWFWDFGNGNTSTLTNPTFTFDSGSYSIKLRVVTTQGCIDSTRFDSIRAGVKPVAAFSASPNPACAFQQIQFTDLSTGNPDQWYWDFRDGGNSINRNPLYSFDDTTGTFRVLLIAYNNRCADSSELDIDILPPVARFTYNVQCTVNKRAVNFVNQSLVTPAATYIWNFGDGSPVSTASNPTHTYAALGTYVVTLTVTEGGCTNSIQQTLRIVDELADFNASQLNACKHQPINFTSTGYNPANILSYYWSFGDSFTANTANTQHSYQAAGTYPVSFAITDINGCRDTVTKNNYIRINGPAAAFAIQQQQICLNNDVVLTNNSTSDGVNAITSALWNMGDGNTVPSLLSPFTYRYADTGSYTIRLTVTDAAGCFDTIT
ncbi:MAG: PKD domain-containing protein, partial [Lacibacter sp.]